MPELNSSIIPCVLTYVLEKKCLMLVLNLSTKLTIKWNKRLN